jgi:hypothetical protein
MADVDAGVEMEKVDKKPVAKRRKAKKSASTTTPTPTPSDPTKKTKKAKPEPAEVTPRQSVDSVRYDNEDAERGT